MTAGLGIVAADASAEVRIIRPPACVGQTSYLLAGNSGALISLRPDAPDTIENHVIVFRHQPRHGWASQRLLRRFDLSLNDGGPQILNTGTFCHGEG
ncbi:MAG: hypothetical protein AAF936_01990 [Pseudomonadota bacterium]